MAEPFKNIYDQAWVDAAGQRLGAAAGIDPAGLQQRVLPGLLELELKARVQLLADAMADWLPGEFPDQVQVLRSTLGPPADLSRKNQFDFSAWPMTMMVQRHGLQHFEVSTAALYELTQRFSAEFAIRPFLRRYPARTLALLEEWVEDPSPHVRRLVSEGTRPRLPWGERLRSFQQDPTPTLALLERLRQDPHEYVRRSVANHLGDIAKDHPERAVAVVQRWRREAPSDQMDALARQALRHLVKQGDPRALAAMGIDPHVVVELAAFEAPTRVELGGALELTAELLSGEDEPVDLEIDLLIHFRKKDGSLRPKTFKGKRARLVPGERLVLQRRIPLRPVSTRRHYPGLHRVEVQVNGQVLGGSDFELVIDQPR